MGVAFSFIPNPTPERVADDPDWAKQRAALVQCSTFVEGFTVDAAEATFDPALGDTLDRLQELVDRSLVQIGRDARGARRFTLFRSVQEHARQAAGPGDGEEADQWL